MILEFHGVVYMIQVIRCRVVHYFHGVTIFITVVHYNLVHVSIKEFLLCFLSRSEIIYGILIFLNEISLLRINIVWDLVLVEPKRTVPKILTLSQVSHFLNWSNRVGDSFHVGFSRDKLLLAHLDHHFSLVVKDFGFFCINQLILMPSNNITFHIWAFKNWIKGLLVLGLWRYVSSIICYKSQLLQIGWLIVRWSYELFKLAVRVV